MNILFNFMFFLIALLLTFVSEASTFKVVTFNIQKMENSKWDPLKFKALVEGVDFTFMQESLGQEPIQSFGDPSFEWFSGPLKSDFYFYKSWGNEDYDTGLATYSKIAPLTAEILFSPTNEPVSDTPKISTVELYELPELGEKLMIVNTHGLNFGGFLHFKGQMQDIESAIRHHKGPLIWLGDFNTRNSVRRRFLKSIAEKLSLKEVKFSGRTHVGNILDRAFVRGFAVKEAKEVTLNISDHEPLLMELEY